MNDILLITLRTILGYIVLIVMLKIMGKREIGQLSLFDLLILLSIADIMVIGIQKILAFITLKSKSIRTLLDGKESLIINRGKLEYKEMKKQCYNMEDLLSQLRDKDVSNLSEVEYAILENNGKLSVFKYNFLKIKSENPFPLILDGKIQTSTLKYINKDKTWLLNLIGNKDVSEVFYCFYKNNKAYIIDKKDVK